MQHGNKALGLKIKLRPAVVLHFVTAEQQRSIHLDAARSALTAA